MFVCLKSSNIEGNACRTLLKIKLYIYGESLAAAGCQRLALNLRPAMVTVK